MLDHNIKEVRTMKKVFGIILVLAMLLSIAPALEVVAADATTWTKVESLADIGANDTFAITITVGGNTYVLPVVSSTKAAESTAIPEITGTVDGNTLTISDTENSFGWNLVATEGGYHIKSGEMYLFVAASNNGIRIAKKTPDATFVWNVLDCGLLGASEGTSYRTLCVDGTMEDPQWGAYPTANKGADGQANSKVRDNVLGLWKLNNAHDCVDADPKDHKCDICGAELSTCADNDPKDHKCDLCGAELSSCTDEPKDGDHKCDVCGAENITQHADTDDDKRCDDCGAAMCEGAHPDENPKDHICDVCGGVVSECTDNDPKDHKCDICGETMSECADAEGDQDHNCDVCGAENISTCGDAAGDGDHKCDECGVEDVTDHKWVDATTEAPKTCTECGATEGEPLPLSPTPEGAYWVKVDDLADIAEGEKLAISITIDGVTYVLPNAQVTNSVSAPNLDAQGVISEDGRFLTVESGHRGFNWTVVPAEDGYYIMSGSMYLWVDNGNAGLRISATDAPATWKVFSGSHLLGAMDPAGNLRTMCIRDGIWQSFKVSSETAQAHSSVRNNVLGLWKYVPDPAGSPDTGDSAIAVVFATMIASAMGVVALVPKKKF